MLSDKVCDTWPRLRHYKREKLGRPAESQPLNATGENFLEWLKGKEPEGKNFRKLLRRPHSSTKISKISRNTLKSSTSDLFYLLKNLLKYLLRTFLLPRSFQKFLSSAFLPRSSFRISAPEKIAPPPPPSHTPSLPVCTPHHLFLG